MKPQPQPAYPLDPKKRWVANWLKRRGYRLMNSGKPAGIEWWGRGDLHSDVTVTVSNENMQYEAVFRLIADEDVHVRIYLRDLGTQAARARLMEFERMRDKMTALSLAGSWI